MILCVVTGCIENIPPESENMLSPVSTSVTSSPQPFSETVATSHTRLNVNSELTHVATDPASSVSATTISETSAPQSTSMPTIDMTLTQPILTPIPTLSTEWFADSLTPFIPVENPDHHILISSNDALWHPDSKSAMSLPVPAGWHIYSWSPTGKHLLMYEWGGSIGIFSLEQGDLEIFDNISFQGGSWSPDGVHLAITDLQGQMNLFSLESNEFAALENAPKGGWPYWSPDGQYLFYRGFEDGDDPDSLSGVIYNLHSREALLQLEPVVFWRVLGWSVDSKWVAFLKWDGERPYAEQILLEVVNITTGEQIIYENLSGNIWLDGFWSPTNNQILLSGANAACGPDIPYQSQFPIIIESMDLIDLDTGEMTRLKELPDDQKCVSVRQGYRLGGMPWSPHGDTLTYTSNRQLCFLDILSQEENCLKDLYVALTGAGYGGINSPSWSPDGQWIALFLPHPDQYGEFVSAIRR
ncbi:MAG TPA: hypothetical protein PLK31_20905, partial [Chloroflexota bacterium]|nr:hypothetical protein [Chloroflexota bacterium]